jgi:hydrogenase maturation protein HypF
MISSETAEHIRIRGLVQGVGFRPKVWHLAQECGLRGAVWNDAQGVAIHICGEAQQIDLFCQRLLEDPPPLARIDALYRQAVINHPEESAFVISNSRGGEIQTGVVPDAATCHVCLEDIQNPQNRRYRYPFTNCTHCGPRLTIVEAIPYDRRNTSMRHFELCDECRREYEDPADRRFHAQPNACPRCGPKVWLCDAQGDLVESSKSAMDAIQEASRRMADGAIVAIKGIGGFHLACDASNGAAVSTLRRRKRRQHKPFALMARDCAVIRNYCGLSEREAEWLAGSAAPIVLLGRCNHEGLALNLAPGQKTLGFMLPYSPLHHLLLAEWESPLVMTSGNVVEEPQCVDNHEAIERLRPLADLLLLHDRNIINRVDDSVVRLIGGECRILRRARGYAPAPLPLPAGFEQAPQLLALGGELKNTFCLIRQGQAILSQHIGDLENLIAYQDYLKNLALYAKLYDHHPTHLVADCHPNYRSTQHAKVLAEAEALTLILSQHHHAHIASVLAENHWPLAGGKVLGIALDGSGYGEDGTVWGGEFLLADYAGFERLGHLCSVPLPGGTQAIRQPWRNSFSQLNHYFGWQQVLQQWGALEPVKWLNQQPVDTLSQMIKVGINSPLSSSCGRLFDAVAAILGICRDEISYEGQAAIELESMAQQGRDANDAGYRMQIMTDTGRQLLTSKPLWEGLLNDLRNGVSREKVAWRFHSGLALSLSEMASGLARQKGLDTIALSGGVFQNKTLFELVSVRLTEQEFRVLCHRNVPSNDGGLALGQAVIGAAAALV